MPTLTTLVAMVIKNGSEIPEFLKKVVPVPGRYINESLLSNSVIPRTVVENEIDTLHECMYPASAHSLTHKPTTYSQ